MSGYFSEIKYLGPGINDFIEIALDAGENPSDYQVVVFYSNGTVRSTNGLGTLDNSMFGQDIYTVETAASKKGAIALVKNGTVSQFVSFNNQVTVPAGTGPAAGMTSTQIGNTGTNQNAALISTDGGATYQVSSPLTPGTIPCFASGTLIDTEHGPRPVETLARGDQIVTATGLQPLQWIGQVDVDLHDAGWAEAAPVVIPAHALGANVPSADLALSPNHRVLMSGPEYELHFGEHECLVPAKHLIGRFGIYQRRDLTCMTYWHLMFDTHQIVQTHGIKSESFHPGNVGLSGWELETRRELSRLFPGLIENPAIFGPTALPCLRQYEVAAALG